MSSYRPQICLAILLLTAINFTVFAQLSIDLPLANTVLQRNSSNTANISITGSYTSGVASAVEAKLFYPDGVSTVTGFDWTIIDSAPSKGHFYGTLNNVPGGWYVLKVRVSKTGVLLSESSPRKIGVGDVFLAFGQSNAQGWAAYPGITATNDQVVTHPLFINCASSNPTFPTLSKITGSGNISTTGENGWYWGALGDKLISSKSVPVAIFNAAVSGAALKSFLESSTGSTTIHPFLGIPFCQSDSTTAAGRPYEIFRQTIEFYHALFGIRAILFMQGESDKLLGTSQISYANKLDSLITLSRNEIGGAKIPWVVSRTSYFNGSSSLAVTNAQTASANVGNQIFLGPSTDDITGPSMRADSTHFSSSTAYMEVAERWRNLLTTNIYNSNTQSFYDLSIPVPAKSMPNISVSIAGLNVTLTAPGGYASYKWVSGDNYDNATVSTAATIVKTSGSYRCYMTDAYGNKVVSKKMNVGDILAQQSLPTAFSDSVYLSDYTPYSLENGLGPVAFNKRAGGSGDNDGGPILLDGITHTKGIGIHSGSEIVYKLNTGFHRYFRATIGIDDAVTMAASVKFKVYGDNTLLYESGTKTHDTPAEKISVLIAGYSSLKLEVDNVSGALSNNQADWASARIVYDKPVISVTDTLSRCLSVSWTHANAGAGITQYKVYKNGALQATLSSATSSYTYTGLNRNTNYTLAVKGLDTNGNETALSSVTVKTVNPSVQYPTAACVGEPTLPIVLIPKGGTFNLLSGGGIASINPSTGEVTFSSEGNAMFRYIICGDTLSSLVYGRIKPSQPTISASIDLINIGDSVSLTSSPCSPYDFLWSDGSTSNPYKVSPSDTTTYFMQCANFCLSNPSNSIEVRVIPDCPNTFQLISVTDDLNYGSESFDFKSTQTIQAANKLYSPTGALYKASKSILLQPGFEARPGSVFSALIGGCP